MMLAYSASDRPDDLGDVQELMDGLLEAGSTTEEEYHPEVAAPRTHPVPTQSRLGDMVVLGYLGCGGNFHAYKVATQVDDSREYVAKVVRYPELLSSAEREFAALNGIHHPNIVRAVAVDTRPEAPYHILEHFVHGRTLRDLVAQEGPRPVQNVLQWARELADALAYLETRNPTVCHGDISARNIMISGDDQAGTARLIDFGLAHVDVPGTEPGVVGTAPYRPPERDRPGAPWPPSGDLYSLAITLGEALLGDLPYETDGGEYRKDGLREGALGALPDMAPGLLQVLLTAMSPDPHERFPTATAMLDALAQLEGADATPTTAELERACNSLVDDLVRLYNHGRCNVENRGLDSEYAWRTYVGTELDERLWPQIRDRQYALVILTGNPGDGKTAFFQQVARRLGRSEQIPSIHHWDLETDDGWVHECVLDGSASDSGRGLASSDEVLDNFFAPLSQAGNGTDLAQSVRRTHLLAINDGRLLEYLEERDDWLADQIRIALGEQPGQAHPQVAVVDLNERSLFSRAADPGAATDAFTRILSSLLGENREDDADPWAVCKRCRARARCHIHYNVTAFRDPAIGPQVHGRLRQLLQLVHARARLHLTIRELRSFIAYLLTHDMTCERIHCEMEQVAEVPQGRDGEAPADPEAVLRERLYWNQLFAAGEEAGPLCAELTAFDPALADSPRLDREVSSMLLQPRGIGELLLQAERGMTLVMDQDGAGGVCDPGGH